MKYFLTLIIAFSSSLQAEEKAPLSLKNQVAEPSKNTVSSSEASICEDSIIKKYKLNKKISGRALYKQILKLDSNKHKEFITNAVYEVGSSKTRSRLEFNYDESDKLYHIQSNISSIQLPATTSKIESVLQKLSSPKQMILEISQYKLKDKQSLFVYNNGQTIIRVVLGKDFSCEFTDFTNCMCAE